MAANTDFEARAFVSCSLRPNDENFVNFICEILKEHHIEPFGTVGKFDASPENPVTLMKKNIEDADLVVIAATPRYLKQDVANHERSFGISEMLHVEAGMAHANDLPVVVFVQKGVETGGAFNDITQSIILDGTPEDYRHKKNLISKLIENALEKVRENQARDAAKAAGTIIGGGLAIFGVATLYKNWRDRRRRGSGGRGGGK